jgi:hypothetical protein
MNDGLCSRGQDLLMALNLALHMALCFFHSLLLIVARMAAAAADSSLSELPELLLLLRELLLEADVSRFRFLFRTVSRLRLLPEELDSSEDRLDSLVFLFLGFFFAFFRLS